MPLTRMQSRSKVNTGFGTSDSFRRKIVMSVDLDVEALERLVCIELDAFCDEHPDIQEQIDQVGHGLADRCNYNAEEMSSTDSSNIIMMLRSMLEIQSVEVPRSMIAKIHSNIALLRQQRKEYDLAVSSLMKALWMETSQSPPDAERIGITMHRLGILHGKRRNKVEAMALLHKARMIYTSVGFRDEHPYQTSAKDALAGLERKDRRKSGIREIPLTRQLIQLDRRLSL